LPPEEGKIWRRAEERAEALMAPLETPVVTQEQAAEFDRLIAALSSAR
jgi:hypothetical protein